MVKIYDNKKTYEFIARISYGNTAINKPTSTYLPLNGRYPSIQRTSNLNYKSGSITALMMVGNKMNRYESTELAKEFCEFLGTDTEKHIEDCNGIHLIVRFDGISSSYNSNYGNGVVTVSANWIEQGTVE